MTVGGILTDGLAKVARSRERHFAVCMMVVPLDECSMYPRFVMQSSLVAMQRIFSEPSYHRQALFWWKKSNQSKTRALLSLAGHSPKRAGIEATGSAPLRRRRTVAGDDVGEAVATSQLPHLVVCVSLSNCELQQ